VQKENDCRFDGVDGRWNGQANTQANEVSREVAPFKSFQTLVSRAKQSMRLVKSSVETLNENASGAQRLRLAQQESASSALATPI